MRSSPLIEYSSTVLMLCLWLGAITTVFSSLIGLFQQDIKKVIAYSTMSQLGMMVIAVGLSSYNVALFHLVNHAFYKALLFLGAGAVIHAVSDNQDFRRYGGLRPFLPLTYSVMLIASLSLVAFPFMTGFYSKDFILESAYGQYYFSGTVVYIIATIGAMFTTLYSVKVLYLTFLTNPNGPLINYKNAHEGDIFMSLPAGRRGMPTIVGNKLSNSGDTLKLLIPNYSKKANSGWTNHSEMVISQKIRENEMGNRGSKSEFEFNHYPTLNSVKEQRVDGSWYKGFPFVFKVYSKGFRNKLSNQNPFLANMHKNCNMNFIRNVSSLSVKQLKLHPYFVTGFSDGEGYFSIGINRSIKMNTGWIVNLQFGISLHKKDLHLLQLIQTFFGGVGTITSHGDTKVQYRVSSIKDLQVIVQHFDGFPLITQKWSDFQLFKKAFEVVKYKEHLTIKGLTTIVGIKASMNLGLSDHLSEAFLNIISIERPVVQSTKIIDPNWLSGFVSGEGNFFVNVLNSKTTVGKQVILMFSISQHSRDANLLRSICDFLNCGNYYPRSNREEGNYTVTKFSDIEQIIKPFFKTYQVLGVKSLDYSDFCEVIEIIKAKEHLTEQGLAKIEKIKSRMNTKRVT